ncbi:Uncharacterised protein [Mycobacteroides abscessus subsp. abscessus]|nr:Uncharacterised protein [Mycobacteroides abscessus subsp. abscessus]
MRIHRSGRDVATTKSPRAPMFMRPSARGTGSADNSSTSRAVGTSGASAA